MRLGRLPGHPGPRLGRRRGLRQRRRCPSGTGTATRSTTTTASARAGRAGRLGRVARRPAGRVRRAARATSTRSTPATQAHPELKSRPTRAHPLFRAFVGAALDYNAAERLPVEIPDERGADAADDGPPAPDAMRAAGPGRSSDGRAGQLRGRRVRDEVRRQDHHGPRRRRADERRLGRPARGRRPPRRGRRRRARRRGQGRAGQPVPARRSAPGSTSCRPACSTSTGESALDAAQRELAEEAGLRADEWDVLLDLHTSPGHHRRGDPDLPGPRAAPRSTTTSTAEHEELTMTVDARAARRGGAPRARRRHHQRRRRRPGILAAVHGRAHRLARPAPGRRAVAGPAAAVSRLRRARLAATRTGVGGARLPRPPGRRARRRRQHAELLPPRPEPLPRLPRRPRASTRSPTSTPPTVSGFLAYLREGDDDHPPLSATVGRPRRRGRARPAPLRAARRAGRGRRVARGPPGRAAAPAAQGDHRRGRRAAARRRRATPAPRWRCATARCSSCSTAPARASPRRSGWTSTTST